MDYRAILKEYMLTVYKIYGEFPDVCDFIYNNVGKELHNIEKEILLETKNRSNKIVDLGELAAPCIRIL